MRGHWGFGMRGRGGLAAAMILGFTGPAWADECEGVPAALKAEWRKDARIEANKEALGHYDAKQRRFAEDYLDAVARLDADEARLMKAKVSGTVAAITSVEADVTARQAEVTGLRGRLHPNVLADLQSARDTAIEAKVEKLLQARCRLDARDHLASTSLSLAWNPYGFTLGVKPPETRLYLGIGLMSDNDENPTFGAPLLFPQSYWYDSDAPFDDAEYERAMSGTIWSIDVGYERQFMLARNLDFRFTVTYSVNLLIDGLVNAGDHTAYHLALDECWPGDEYDYPTCDRPAPWWAVHDSSGKLLAAWRVMMPQPRLQWVWVPTPGLNLGAGITPGYLVEMYPRVADDVDATEVVFLLLAPTFTFGVTL